MFNFGTRKINNMGYSRFVTLPKEWMKAMNLDKNDEIGIKMNEKCELILTPIRRSKID